MKLNILDYSPIDEGGTTRQALKNTTKLAQAAEKAGFHRFWLSEHHEVPSVAGSNPEMIMMHVADHTESIRVGSGGVMLPHYSSYKVAENFKILENYHPGRIDLGIGRSPSYPAVNRALNEDKRNKVAYNQQIEDIHHYLEAPVDGHRFGDLTATPISDTTPDIWLLGTSKNSAKMAADRGMNYAYAKFGRIEGDGVRAMATYRENFTPSKTHAKPQTMISLFVVVGETSKEAEELAKTLQLWCLWIEGKYPKPQFMPSVETANSFEATTDEQKQLDLNKKRIIWGIADDVHDQLIDLADRFGADELTLMPHYAGFENRLKGMTALMATFK